jgi:hypothetical protein
MEKSVAEQLFGKHQLKARIVETEWMSIAEQQPVNHVPLQRIATNESLSGSKLLNTNWQ